MTNPLKLRETWQRLLLMDMHPRKRMFPSRGTNQQIADKSLLFLIVQLKLPFVKQITLELLEIRKLFA